MIVVILSGSFHVLVYGSRSFRVYTCTRGVLSSNNLGLHFKLYSLQACICIKPLCISIAYDCIIQYRHVSTKLPPTTQLWLLSPIKQLYRRCKHCSYLQRPSTSSHLTMNAVYMPPSKLPLRSGKQRGTRPRRLHLFSKPVL